MASVFVAQTDAFANSINENPVMEYLDIGTTIAGLSLLAYVLRLVFSGNLVTKSLVIEIVEHTVRDLQSSDEIEEAVEKAVSKAFKEHL